MTQFLVVLNQSSQTYLTDVETATAGLGAVFCAYDLTDVSPPATVVIVDGDSDARQKVLDLGGVEVASDVDTTLDTTNLSLSDDALNVVNGWNARWDTDYQTALANPVRDGETWDFPDGCEHDGTPSA
jgi:hypothetical protein